MRVSALRFLLPLFLLFAQQEGLLHEIGHSGEAIRWVASTGKHAPADGKPCDKCLAFAAIAGAVHSEAPALIVLHLAFDQPLQSERASIAAEMPSPRSRGPPLFL
jgi:hypothetical protein